MPGRGLLGKWSSEKPLREEMVPGREGWKGGRLQPPATTWRLPSVALSKKLPPPPTATASPETDQMPSKDLLSCPGLVFLAQ